VTDGEVAGKVYNQRDSSVTGGRVESRERDDPSDNGQAD